jgi:RimJ/RimL family protein N-acetyltransferase
MISIPHGSVVIRLARETDAQNYRDLRLEALKNHPEAFSSDYETYLVKPVSYWEDRLREQGTDSSVKMYFAEHEAQLIGMAGIVRQNSPKGKHSALIISMYVRPDWRGLRIADGLIAACVDWARTEEIRVVKLAVVTTNTPAIRCYARCGFQVYGVEPKAIFAGGIFYDELLMAKSLDE